MDLDTGNNARLTYKLHNANTTGNNIFGIFPNSGWIYLQQTLDREIKDRYNISPGRQVSRNDRISYFRFELIVVATDNGTPSESATTKVSVQVLDANDNDPKFSRESYEFSIEENLRRGSFVGRVQATDADLESNAVVKYSLIPGNTSFHINPSTGKFPL